MNPLNTIASDKWIGDGSGGALDAKGSSESEPVTLAFSSATRGTPFNVRLLEGDEGTNLPPAASFFYELEIVEATGSMSVGVVTEEGFQPGWKTRGMFFNGNLSNGSAGLKIGFGDSPAAGDKVGVYVVRSDSDPDAATRVVFYLNGRCLGTAFLVTSDDVFYPCLHLDGKGVVKYSAPKSFPANIEREPARYADPYSGDWSLKKAFTGPELGQFPIPDGTFLLSFSAVNESTYRLSVRVGNSMSTTLNITGKMEAFDKIKVGPVMSTRMMPPPELRNLDDLISSSLEELYKMIVSDSGDLIMTAPTAELICSRYEKAFEPVTSYT